jgi:hypothetical protein
MCGYYLSAELQQQAPSNCLCAVQQPHLSLLAAACVLPPVFCAAASTLGTIPSEVISGRLTQRTPTGYIKEQRVIDAYKQVCGFVGNPWLCILSTLCHILHFVSHWLVLDLPTNRHRGLTRSWTFMHLAPA